MPDVMVPGGWLAIGTGADATGLVELLFIDGRREKVDAALTRDWPEGRPLPVAWRPVDAPTAATPDFDRLRKGII